MIDPHPLAFLQRVLEHAPAYIAHIGPDDRVRYVNKPFGELSREAIVGMLGLDLAHPDDRPRVERAMAEARAQGSIVRFRSRAMRPDGSETIFDNWIVPVPDDEPGALATFAIDVTDVAAAEQAAQASAAKLRLAVEAAEMGLFETDLRVGHTEWDDRMWEIHRQDPLHDPSLYIERMVHPDDRARLAQMLATAAGGQTETPEYRIVRPNGEVRWVRMSITAFQEEGVMTRFLGGVIDTTDQRVDLERQRRAQKLEAIGTLTAGVAHNFNNLLMVLVAIFEELRTLLPDQHRQALRDAGEALERGRQMVASLLDFAGQRNRAPTELRFDDLLRRAVRLCEQTFSAGIAIRARIEGPLWVRGDEAALDQLVVNLLLNARDALQPSGGTLTVRATGDGDVRLEVSDDGPGIAPDLLPTIFEPFVSTKGKQATGLGLATALAIAREHGGSLEVASEPGEGATFTLTLPSVDAS